MSVEGHAESDEAHQLCNANEGAATPPGIVADLASNQLLAEDVEPQNAESKGNLNARSEHPGDGDQNEDSVPLAGATGTVFASADGGEDKRDQAEDGSSTEETIMDFNFFDDLHFEQEERSSGDHKAEEGNHSSDAAIIILHSGVRKLQDEGQHEERLRGVVANVLGHAGLVGEERNRPGGETDGGKRNTENTRVDAAVVVRLHNEAHVVDRVLLVAGITSISGHLDDREDETEQGKCRKPADVNPTPVLFPFGSDVPEHINEVRNLGIEEQKFE